MFAEETAWKTPWMERVRPVVAAIAREHAPATIFTRFIPAAHPGEGAGAWGRYWQRWPMMTLSQLGEDKVALLPELAAVCPPALTFDKRAFAGARLRDFDCHRRRNRRVRACDRAWRD